MTFVLEDADKVLVAVCASRPCHWLSVRLSTYQCVPLRLIREKMCAKCAHVGSVAGCATLPLNTFDVIRKAQSSTASWRRSWKPFLSRQANGGYRGPPWIVSCRGFQFASGCRRFLSNCGTDEHQVDLELHMSCRSEAQPR